VGEAPSEKPTAMLQTVLPVLIGLSLAAVVIVLGIGVVSMLRGGGLNRKYGNHLMRARVATQALTVLLLVVYFLTGRAA
jgi:hypothetical protein